VQVRLVVQAEHETLRVYERMSRVGCVLSACCLLDTVTAAHLLSAGDGLERTSDSSRSCDEMMRDIVEKFMRLRVSRFEKHLRRLLVILWRMFTHQL